MGFALGGSIAWGIMYSPPEHHSADNHQAAEHTTEKENKNGFWEKAGEDPVAYFTLWLVGFTGVLAVSTIGLWIVTWRASKAQGRDMKASIDASKRAADIAHDAMIAGERAFVFATGVLAYWEIHKPTGQYHWRFRPNWENSGDTPTKNMTMHSECLLVPSQIMPGFNFDYPTNEIGTALLPPKTKAGGGMVPRFPAAAITPSDIVEIQNGQKLLYFWGWARYYDVFPGTPQHITRFCWRLLVTGDPFRYNPNSDPQNVQFSNIHHFEGNCADDECKEHGPNRPEAHDRAVVAFAP
ncbi:hypothetical protein FXB40_19935 [Bradyrhizobium rifense]|uniref:Uncharacterized protein n=1 Tax=Bradyrhizobium rifense TaxID=515499 RepID=A0A5D3KC92_9BRAD|nr:hypothetical protein [Bradyrhizobium rifense]TYL94098.1 hypothetical protein FXB40_19935 [Bradyrhizobium rifense]